MCKRLCRKCGKPLAELNREDLCFCHQEGMVIKEKHPMSGCTSFLKSADDVNAPNFYLKPGDPGYNDMAFDETVVGAVDEDGSIYEIDLGILSDGEDVYDHPEDLVNIDDLNI